MRAEVDQIVADLRETIGEHGRFILETKEGAPIGKLFIGYQGSCYYITTVRGRRMDPASYSAAVILLAEQFVPYGTDYLEVLRGARFTAER